MLKNYLMVFFVSMVPVIELRGALSLIHISEPTRH